MTNNDQKDYGSIATTIEDAQVVLIDDTASLSSIHHYHQCAQEIDDASNNQDDESTYTVTHPVALFGKSFRWMLGTVLLMVAVAHWVYSSGSASSNSMSATLTSSPPPPPASSKLALSQRGQSVGMVRDDLPMFEQAAADPYHPIDNPEGYLILLVAENKLLWPTMARQLQSATQQRQVPEWVLQYGAMGGQRDFVQAMARLFQRWMRNPQKPHQALPVDPQYVRTQDGAGSVLSQLSYLLTDPGQAVLTLAPAYTAFAGDFGVYGQAVLRVVQTTAAQDYFPTSTDQLDAVYHQAVRDGHPPKIFVICQPNNPTGVIYTYEQMKFLMQWALSKPDLHVVSDEIYALSTFPDAPAVTSAAAVMYDTNHPTEEHYLTDRVHIVAGLSKDWGMSGLRVGTLFSHNTALLQALDMIGYYQMVSQYTQWALTQVFANDTFVHQYIHDNRRALAGTYAALEEALARIDVPLYAATQGALFGWADFSGHLRPGQSEHELWLELFDSVKVALTTGESFFGDKPGLFRIVYPWPEGGVEAMHELGDRLVQWRDGRRES